MVGDTQIFKVFSEDRVQNVSSRSLIFPVEVFKVLALDRVRQRLRLFTLQPVRMMTRRSLVKGAFALKVRSWLRARGRHCSPSRSHSRRLLSWRTPSSGCGSGNAALARPFFLRHVVGHLSVPALDVLVPQMVDQLPDIEQFFRVLSPDCEQGIEVPKILPFDVPMRAVLRVTRLVEQLVEVPTISSPIPRSSGLWSSTSTFQFLVVEDQVLVFKVFSSGQGFNSFLLPPRNAFLSGLWSRSLTCFKWTSSWFSPRTRFIFFPLSNWC